MATAPPYAVTALLLHCTALHGASRLVGLLGFGGVLLLATVVVQ